MGEQTCLHRQQELFWGEEVATGCKLFSLIAAAFISKCLTVFLIPEREPEDGFALELGRIPFSNTQRWNFLGKESGVRLISYSLIYK